MNCNPAPTTPCGDTYNDSCVNITGTWPTCLPTGGNTCFRQSDFNAAAGTLLCALGAAITGTTVPIGTPVVLPTGVTSILSSITLTGLTGCTSPLAITPVKTTVAAEFQNIYNILCTNLPVSLNTPLVLGAAPGLSLGCLQAPCGVPISTLGGVLQALINSVCANQGLVFEALISQSGTAAPTMTILADTIDPAMSNLTLTRVGVGSYVLNANLTYLPNGFPAGETTIFVGSAQNFTGQIIAFWQSASQIAIQTAVSGAVTDGILNNTSLKIKIY